MMDAASNEQTSLNVNVFRNSLFLDNATLLERGKG